MAITPSNGKTLLITGINGYIASTLGLLLLTKGYNLRGTSRSAKSSAPLLTGPYKEYASRVQLFEVPDMTAPGAFDEAVVGVHGIFHVASPISLIIDKYEELVIPAVRGSKTLLQSALEKAGPQLEAVVVTSSVAAVFDPSIVAKDEFHAFTELDFAHTNLEKATEIYEKGLPVNKGILYSASKTAAERAVWEFKKANNPSFAISTINPGVVIGPPVLPPTSPEKLNVTLKPIWDVFGGGLSEVPASIGSSSFVDVRDVAYMHYWAYTNPTKSNGERYIGCGGYGPLQAAADCLREEYPTMNIPKGTPGEGYLGYVDGKVQEVRFPKNRVSISGDKAQREMGLEWRKFKDSVLDTAEVMKSYL